VAQSAKLYELRLAEQRAGKKIKSTIVRRDFGAGGLRHCLLLLRFRFPHSMPEMADSVKTMARPSLSAAAIPFRR